jgi:hypothetical protein
MTDQIGSAKLPSYETFDSKVLKLFRGAVRFLRIDDEGVAPSELEDVLRAADLCLSIRMWSVRGQLPELAKSDPFFAAVEALEDVLGTYAVVAPDNPEVVARWRSAWAAFEEMDVP